LHLFRLEKYENYKPTELSGGQQQKLGVCRALITNPWIVLADEPTGNLDTVSAADLMYLFKFMNDDSKRTIIMVTHNPEYEKFATKIIYMEDGSVKRVDVKKKLKHTEESLKDILNVGEAK
jgi:putative ABC transport system ATP-binding protein